MLSWYKNKKMSHKMKYKRLWEYIKIIQGVPMEENKELEKPHKRRVRYKGTHPRKFEEK